VRGRVREQAEGRAGVFRVGDAEEAGDDLDVRVHGDAGGNSAFRPAIKQDYGEG